MDEVVSMQLFEHLGDGVHDPQATDKVERVGPGIE